MEGMLNMGELASVGSDKRPVQSRRLGADTGRTIVSCILSSTRPHMIG